MLLAALQARVATFFNGIVSISFHFYYCFKLHTFQSIQELTKMVKQLKQEVESQENLDEKRSL